MSTSARSFALAAAVTGVFLSGAHAVGGDTARSILGFSGTLRMQGLTVPSDLELVQAQIVFRHGARSPFQDSPDAPTIYTPDLRAKAAKLPNTFQLVDYSSGIKLPLSNAMGGSAGAADRSISEENTLGGGLKCGMLTEAGLEQAKMLGKRLNDAYVKTGFVESITSPGHVLLRSSLTARTVETLYGCVSGMFPADVAIDRTYDVVVGKKGVGSKHTDWINVSFESCPKLLKLFQAGVQQWNGDQMPPEVLAFMDDCLKTTQLQKIQGDAKKYGIIAWRDWISCRLGSGLPLQPGVSQTLFDQVDRYAARQAASWFVGGLERGPHDRSVALRLAHGRTLAEIVSRLEAARSGGDAHRVVLYSAHDWTVMPLLMMLSDPIESTPWPSYCSTLRFELLRQRSGARKYFVRVFYCNGTHGKDQPWAPERQVSIMGSKGGNLVELSKFCSLVSPFLPGDYDQECECLGA